MINLIRNELYKIFHKSTIYIFLIIGVFCYTLLGGLNLLDSFSSNSYYSGESNDESHYKENAKQQLANLYCDPWSCDKKYNNFVTLQANTTIKYLDFKDKYKDSDIDWIRKYIKELSFAGEINNGWYDYNNSEKNKALTTIINDISNNIDKITTFLDTNDSKGIIEFEITRIEAKIKRLEAEEKINKQKYERALVKYNELCKDENFDKKNSQWEFENNSYIGEPYYNEMYELGDLRQKKVYYEQMKDYGLENEQREILATKYTDKYNQSLNAGGAEKQKYERALGFAQYSLDYNIDWNIEAENPTLKELLITNISFFFIAFAIVIFTITSTIFSEEYSKGTIKFLLTTPNSRTKIFLSKFITTLIMSLFFILLMILVYGFAFGAFNGDFFMIFKGSPLYNYGTNTVTSVPLIVNSLIIAGGLIPYILIVIILSLLLSIITESNKAAFIIPLLGILGSSAVLMVMNLLVDKWFIHILNILPFASWDFNQYLFGRLPDYKMISFTGAILISSIWVALLFVISLIAFKKKDIKNN